MKRSILKALFLIGSVSLVFITLGVSEAAYVIEHEPNDTYSTAQNLDSLFTYSENPMIEVDEKGNLGPINASVYGFSGDSTFDYYSFNVGTTGSSLQLNTTVAFDIDFSYVNGLDSIIVLYDSDGTTLLKYNDDKPEDGPGDLKSNTLNSFLTYTFTLPGTYYIRISEFSAMKPYGDVLETDATYHLHISTLPMQADLLLFMVPSIAAAKKQKE